MKKLFGALLGLSILGTPIMAEPKLEPHSWAAMGCMKLGDCRKDVYKITDISQLREIYGKDWASDFDQESEIQLLISFLNSTGVNIYVGPSRNFPRGHRGMYYVDNNEMFLNSGYTWNEDTFLTVLRHEGWHAAQDCMAGTINNTYLAIIMDDRLIPDKHKLTADIRYGPGNRDVLPWEREAVWAGAERLMTVKALTACREGDMWNFYEPTPLTAEWLINNGYMLPPE